MTKNFLRSGKVEIGQKLNENELTEKEQKLVTKAKKELAARGDKINGMEIYLSEKGNNPILNFLPSETNIRGGGFKVFFIKSIKELNDYELDKIEYWE